MSEPKHPLLCHCDSNEAGPDGMRKHGALVRVDIGPAPDDLESRRIAKTLGVSMVLMIDTGARFTFADDRILQRLGLPMVRLEEIRGIFPDARDCPVYNLAITLNMIEDRVGTGHRFVFPLEIFGLPSQHHPQYAMGLLGRDFLEGVGLFYDGPAGTCSMSRRVLVHG